MTEKTTNRLTQKKIWEISKNIEADIELYRDTEYKFIVNEMNKIFDYEITVSKNQIKDMLQLLMKILKLLMKILKRLQIYYLALRILKISPAC